MEYNINKSTIEDKKISIAIMSSFAILTIQYLVLIYFNLIGTITGQIIQLISKGIVGFFYLLALPIVFNRTKIKFIATYFIVVFLFILNYALFGENLLHLKTITFPLFITGLPSFIYAYSIKDWDVLMDIMRKTSKITFAIGTIIGILAFVGIKSVGSYSMSLSYYMLLPSIMYMNDFIEEKSINSIVLLTITLTIIFALGSRGAIMCFGVFTILKAIKSIKNITYGKMLISLVILSVIVLGLIFYKDILEYIYNILLSYGIYSRTMVLFLGKGVYLSGRDSLYKIVIEEIFKRPFLGIGIAGDRVLIGDYVHNIFIELLANFGIVFGTLIIMILLYRIYESVIVKDIKKYNMHIIWVSLGFVHLFVSSSYLIDFKFWIMLGLILNNNSTKFVD